MGRFKIFLVTVFSLSLILGLGLGIRQATHSSMFILKNVEIKKPLELPLSVRMTEDDLLELADVPVGDVSIFELDLQGIEERLLTQFWIKGVQLQRKLPNTIVLDIEFRKPKAFLQNPKGGLVFVDDDGELFGSANESNLSDLPLLSGFSETELPRIREGLDILSRWEGSSLGESTSISTIHWDQEKGYRLLISYLQRDSRIRTIVDIGHEIDASFEAKLVRLSSVVNYLSGNSIAVRQIWADIGKKIVVKTARGS